MPRWSLIAAALLFSLPALAQTTVIAPALPQPSASSDIVAVRLLNTTGASMSAGWTAQGQPFKDGDVPSGQLLAARQCSNAGCTTGSNVYVGYDCPVTHPSDGTGTAGSCWIADLGINSGGTLTAGSHQDFMILKCGGGGQPACPTAPAAPPSAATVANSSCAQPCASDLATPVFATNSSGGFSETDHCTGTGSILANANAGSTTKTRLSNGAFTEYVAQATANSGQLNITCDIRAFTDGTTITDFLILTDWYATSGKSDQIYDFSMTVPSGAVASSFWSSGGSCTHTNAFTSSAKHSRYTGWHCTVKSSGTISPLWQYDVPYFIGTGIVVPVDYNIATQHDAPSSPAGFGIVDFANQLAGTGGPAGSNGLGETVFNITWAQDSNSHMELALDPGQYQQWLLTQDPTAWKNMMILADAVGSVPIHYRNESTNGPIDPTTGNRMGLDTAHQCSCADDPVNGYPTWGNPPTPSVDTYWGPVDWQHTYDFNFLAWVTTLTFWQERTMEDFYVADVLSLPGHLANHGAGVVYCASVDTSASTRGNAHCTADIMRGALYLPDSDPVASINVKTFMRTMLTGTITNGFLYDYEYTGAGFAFAMGEVEGILNNAQAIGSSPPWQTDLLTQAFYVLYRSNYSPYSANAKTLANYVIPVVSGEVTSGNSGFNPHTGASFEFYQCNNAGASSGNCYVIQSVANASDYPFFTWNQVYTLIGPPGGQTCPSGTGAYVLPWGKGSSGSPGTCNSDVTEYKGGYNVHHVNHGALLWNITQNPQALDAWAFAVISNAKGMQGASPTALQLEEVFHMWATTMPQMPNGVYLTIGSSGANQVIDTTTSAATINCTVANSFLGAVGAGTKTFNGCNGGYDVMVNAGGGASNFNPGTTGSFIFAAYDTAGIQTFTSNAGNHYMEGCGACLGGGSDVYLFGSGANSGTDTLPNFSPANDTLGVHYPGSGPLCDTAAHVVANCMTTSGQDTTMTINGKTVLFKGIRDKNALTGLISMI